MATNFAEVTMRDFKTRISFYLRQLRLGKLQYIIIKKYNKRFAIVGDYNPNKVPYPRRLP